MTLPLPEEVSVADDPARELIVAGSGPDRAVWYLTKGAVAVLPPPRLHTRVVPVESGYRLTVTAQTLVRDLTVLADRVASDAYVDEALVTLLPGETASFHIHTATAVAPEAFRDPLVLRSANQLMTTAEPRTVAHRTIRSGMVR